MSATLEKRVAALESRMNAGARVDARHEGRACPLNPTLFIPKLPPPERAFGIERLEIMRRTYNLLREAGIADFEQIYVLGGGLTRIPGVGPKMMQELRAAVFAVNPWLRESEAGWAGGHSTGRIPPCP